MSCQNTPAAGDRARHRSLPAPRPCMSLKFEKLALPRTGSDLSMASTLHTNVGNSSTVAACAKTATIRAREHILNNLLNKPDATRRFHGDFDETALARFERAFEPWFGQASLSLEKFDDVLTGIKVSEHDADIVPEFFTHRLIPDAVDHRRFLQALWSTHIVRMRENGKVLSARTDSAPSPLEALPTQKLPPREESPTGRFSSLTIDPVAPRCVPRAPRTFAVPAERAPTGRYNSLVLQPFACKQPAPARTGWKARATRSRRTLLWQKSSTYHGQTAKTRQKAQAFLRTTLKLPGASAT